MEFALQTLEIVKYLRQKREYAVADQFIRCGTSVGANISEAQYAQSRADFVSKMQIALKETNESSFWIELLNHSHYIEQDQYVTLRKRCNQLLAGLTASVKTAKANDPNKNDPKNH